MIFVVETEERTLYAFNSESEAVASCEALDVEAAVWLFWDGRGVPLEPYFLEPNKRGLFTAKNGKYGLRVAAPDHHAVLDEALDEVLRFEAPAPYNSAVAVRAYMAAQKAGSGGA